jgi:GT2 family glycosyltransferase
MDASVVIPTKDRPLELIHCLRALAKQETVREFEVIVVDDGTTPPIDPVELEFFPIARVVRTGGVGAGKARNRGYKEATAPLVLFTDDDTAPSPVWVETACRYLGEHPEEVGVEGPTVSPPFDPLYERSVRNEKAGMYWTCNIAYRREVLVRIGGFADAFPSVHGEDLDLAFRALELGRIGFAEKMVVTHYPTSITVRDLVGHRQHYLSDMVLYTRHGERFVTRVPLRLVPVVGQARYLRGRLRRERKAMVGTPRRFARFSVAAAGALAIAVSAAGAPISGRRSTGPDRKAGSL